MKIPPSLKKNINSIGTKIIIPYVVLTLIVAGIGAFILTNLVTGTLQERFDNQLLDSGRVAAAVMVDYEQERLAVLRSIAGTIGVPDGLSNQDFEALESLVPQIIVNSNADAVVLLDDQGIEVYSWYHAEKLNESKSRKVSSFPMTCLFKMHKNINKTNWPSFWASTRI